MRTGEAALGFENAELQHSLGRERGLSAQLEGIAANNKRRADAQYRRAEEWRAYAGEQEAAVAAARADAEKYRAEAASLRARFDDPEAISAAIADAAAEEELDFLHAVAAAFCVEQKAGGNNKTIFAEQLQRTYAYRRAQKGFESADIRHSPKLHSVSDENRAIFEQILSADG